MIRLGKPGEFGYTGQLVDNADGVVLDHTVEIGAPPDAPMLAPPSRGSHAAPDVHPRAVTADRGYGQASVENDLRELGVRTVVIPRQAKPNPAQRHVVHRRSFRKLVEWRTGSEGRISHLKHGYGWNRTHPTASTEPDPGADTASSPTTRSGSGSSEGDNGPRAPHRGRSAEPRRQPTAPTEPSTVTANTSGRSNLSDVPITT